MTRKVLIDGQVLLYADKAPYVISGHSVRGAIEYDEDMDRVKCHECGRWFRNVGTHLKLHNLTAREYKLTHGLKFTSALICERTRSAFIKAQQLRMDSDPLAFEKVRSKRYKSGNRPGVFSRLNRGYEELRNIRTTCRAQIISKIRELGEQIGRTPSLAELRETGLSDGAMRYHFGSERAAIIAAGLSPRGKGKTIARMQVTDEQVLNSIREFVARHGRVPTQSDCRRGKQMFSTNCYRIRFGGLVRAKYLALFDNSATTTREGFLRTEEMGGNR